MLSSHIQRAIRTVTVIYKIVWFQDETEKQNKKGTNVYYNNNVNRKTYCLPSTDQYLISYSGENKFS